MVMIDETINYLHEFIDETAVYEDWNQRARETLPLFLAGAFDFYLVDLLDMQVLFLKPLDNYSFIKMEKWAEMIAERSGYNIVFILSDASPYIIKKMIADKTAFVVPDKQISLPFLAMQIKKTKPHTSRNFQKFVPLTQLIFLYILYSDKDSFTQNDIVDALNVSPMSAGRGMNDLQTLGLLSFDIGGKTGRKKIYQRLPQSTFYQTGKPYLIDPEKDVIYVNRIPESSKIIKSDLTALSEQTMLGEPIRETYAVYSKYQAELAKYQFSKEQAEMENLPMIQLMKYDVSILAENGYIDPISLILSLKEKDERIDMAIDELLEEKTWFTA